MARLQKIAAVSLLIWVATAGLASAETKTLRMVSHADI
jgi:hypothetical protein